MGREEYGMGASVLEMVPMSKPSELPPLFASEMPARPAVPIAVKQDLAAGAAMAALLRGGQRNAVDGDIADPVVHDDLAVAVVDQNAGAFGHRLKRRRS